MSAPGVDLRGLPRDFVWGAATAAFQIEGDAGHRGESIWDEMCRTPGAILDGSDGRVACDHVARYAEDVALLAGLGAGAYRFSMSWPRLAPGGHVAAGLAADGVAFYDRLLDALLAAEVEPWVTLYHWDLPSELQHVGGWPARSTADRFTEYAVAAHDRFGDRVRHWTTLNEPWCSAWLGHGAGVHAPGARDPEQAARSAHHLLLAHGRAIKAMRAQARPGQEFGIVLNPAPCRAAPGQPPQVVETAGLIDGFVNRWWLDALFRAEYPADVLTALEPHLGGAVRDGDLSEIAAPLDYLGVNYYFDQVFVAGDAGDWHAPYPIQVPVAFADPGPGATSMGWPLTPGGLTDLLRRIAADYPEAPYLVVTENGSAYDDEAAAAAAGPGDVVEDPARVAYLVSHLNALAVAARAGVDVRGYFAWSLLDNFEWSYGYTRRFGLVRVDYDTQVRRPKRSYAVYRDVIAAGR